MIAHSIAGLRALNACKIGDRAASIRAHLGRDVPDDEEIPLTVWAAARAAAEDAARDAAGDAERQWQRARLLELVGAA